MSVKLPKNKMVYIFFNCVFKNHPESQDFLLLFQIYCYNTTFSPKKCNYPEFPMSLTYIFLAHKVLAAPPSSCHIDSLWCWHQHDWLEEGGGWQSAAFRWILALGASKCTLEISKILINNYLVFFIYYWWMHLQ